MGRGTLTGAQADAVNELYDHGADLVEAAAALRQRAAAADASRAAPAVLGCMETALRDLTAVTSALEQSVSAAVDDETEPGTQRRLARMRHGFRNLDVALHDAAGATAAARALAARALRSASARTTRTNPW